MVNIRQWPRYNAINSHEIYIIIWIFQFDFVNTKNIQNEYQLFPFNDLIASIGRSHPRMRFHSVYISLFSGIYKTSNRGAFNAKKSAPSRVYTRDKGAFNRKLHNAVFIKWNECELIKGWKQLRAYKSWPLIRYSGDKLNFSEESEPGEARPRDLRGTTPSAA